LCHKAEGRTITITRFVRDILIQIGTNPHVCTPESDPVETKTNTSQEIRKGTTSFQRPMPPQGDVNMSAIIMPKISRAIDLFDISHNALHQTHKTTTNPAEALTNGSRKDFIIFPTHHNLIFSSVNKQPRSHIF